MKLVTYPNDILKNVAKEVIAFDKDLFLQVKQMFSLMKKENGIGLAANQIGSDLALFVMNIEFVEMDLKRIFINPQLKVSGKLISTKEGCLSFPGICVEVGRHETCEMTFQNLAGVQCQEIFTGLPSIVCQHEYDHLIGKTFIDYLPKENQEKILGKLKI